MAANTRVSSLINYYFFVKIQDYYPLGFVFPHWLFVCSHSNSVSFFLVICLNLFNR